MMNNKGWYGALLLVVGVVAIAGLIILNSYRDIEDVNGDELVVAATIFPLADITQNIGGETVRVVQVIPPGASPHSYQLTPAQVAEMRGAEAVFAIGHGLDDAIIESVVSVSEAKPIIVDKEIELRGFAGGGTDPHYWLSVPNAKLIAETIAEQLISIDPGQTDAYRENLAVYLDELDKLEQELQAEIGQLSQRKFAAMHDAWAYFADNYGLELVVSYEPVEGKQPSLEDMREFGRVVKENSITVFYTEPQKTVSAATRFLETEFDLTVGVLDPVGGIGQSTSYIELMRQNTQALSSDD
jgi:zinc transport system substrate-binding protein